ncbi:hypothetical protein CEE69_00995 [Rhodopirellula bahusiensis]|uniref:Uncharacterized protein n=1 Tax=Rhodopirellula bahusiensis TaxID=2014065 RepID=A0A2G1WD62_9BACT|nr:hypothetical protein CEE69_00995 [Rhodopirellula bahusiensis]
MYKYFGESFQPAMIPAFPQSCQASSESSVDRLNKILRRQLHVGATKTRCRLHAVLLRRCDANYTLGNELSTGVEPKLQVAIVTELRLKVAFRATLTSAFGRPDSLDANACRSKHSPPTTFRLHQAENLQSSLGTVLKFHWLEIGFPPLL